jgi:hypothetical protein
MEGGANMHHVWHPLGAASVSAGNFKSTVQNKNTHAKVKISLPKKKFFSTAGDLTPAQAKDIVAAIVAILNMTDK